MKLFTCESILNFLFNIISEVPNIYALSTLTLNANNKGRAFEGIGAVSAGVSSSI